MINWIKGWFVPSVDSAISGFNKAIAGLEVALGHHQAAGDTHYDKANVHYAEAKRAQKIRDKLVEVVK